MMYSVLLAAAAVTAPVPAMPQDWWSNYYDTPAQGLAPGELSVVVAEMTVNTHGYMAGCTGRVYTGNPQMGPYVCSRLKMRAVFDPARGPDGRKMTGIYRKLITVANVRTPTQFKSPIFGIHVPASGGSASDNPFEIQFYLDANGQVSDCSLTDSVGLNLMKHKQVVDPGVVLRGCAAIAAQLKPVPPRDKHGNAIPTVQNALVIVDRGIDSDNQNR
jgi:hypothetical protein